MCHNLNQHFLILYAFFGKELYIYAYFLFFSFFLKDTKVTLSKKEINQMYIKIEKKIHHVITKIIYRYGQNEMNKWKMSGGNSIKRLYIWIKLQWIFIPVYLFIIPVYMHWCYVYSHNKNKLRCFSMLDYVLRWECNTKKKWKCNVYT